MKSIFLIFIISLSLTLSSTAMGKIEYVEVAAKGHGSHYSEAVNNALSNAIAKVNGKSIETNATLKKISKSVKTNEGKEYFSSKEFEKTIKEATKGFVSTFKILNESKSEKGVVQIEIQAKIGKYELKKSAKRKRIAVLPIYFNKTGYQILNANVSASRIDWLLTQNLVSYLVQTRKFTVLDREYMKAIEGEKSIIKQGDTQIKETVKLGQKLFSDYIFIGNLEKFIAEEKEVKLLTSDKKMKSKKGIIEFNYRIIDVPTSQIMYSNDHRGVYNLNEFSSSTSIESEMIRLTSLEIGQDILYAIYPLRIEKIDGDTAFIGQGGMQLEENDEYFIYELGDKIVDSYTNEVIGRTEKKVGKLIIKNVGAKISSGEIVEQDYKLSDDFFPKKYIIKPIEIEKNIINIAKEKIDKKKKKGSDDDW